ncbi:2,3,4,5-tetrahydropyridine-2,6-dicarboxylate N-acetyltransferase [Fructilactobacillus fructivorans]|uniref:2,3,4,5-tetrahydropyridine-2,6-dicarboxylate N-acetyltransferase n=1 Tax=Fructilactobacillus fructivorans TaxID=1614 RepID=A0A0C1PMQ4_9LACO|nr:2,3,4,5-tetrahydropyridine-2,6-dicarboxylate N-acetyltransferase [Fructilactobacillus fructivorans]KID42037.1 2,3,4,5-tetrahydropyridine-2,6-dicarboxylate N-acetyltransferase [Fructilactobacillus fructivorans]KRK57140.1 2,3,4,5-tetrahydropyridine-2,6-dicarboxylate N-acetyltransferase [Fructilactobacillus fructivorans]KRN40384.1 2,3,4,5-tetrahydropyridine-2,6-dicarboxylate N-acetyltransferase [Fructilactobacillus fructivorans]KRN42726.1 2,3,4,5-tetrahydropyridine-2,6-dicarboxylate N-acetyltra
MAQLDAQSIIKFISESDKKTPVKVYLKGKLGKIKFPKGIENFTTNKTGVIFGDWANVSKFLKKNKKLISKYEIESDARNSAVPLLDTKNLDARIEPGAIIRDQVVIGKHVVIMMGALINIGAEIGDDSMIDMGTILGGRAIVGKHCHIGAGAVLAGVIEPASAEPVRIDDNVLVGANAVVIEGVHVGEGAVIAAGSVVLHDVEPNTMVAGVPAKKIKDIDNQTKSKTKLEDDLRK